MSRQPRRRVRPEHSIREALVGLAHGGGNLAAAAVGLVSLTFSHAEELPRTTTGEFVGATVHLNAGRLWARGARWNREDAVASIFKATRAQFGDVELSEATRLVDLSPDG